MQTTFATITLTFYNLEDYEDWLRSQARTLGVSITAAPQLVEDALAAEAAEAEVEVAETAPASAPERAAKKPRKPRKPRAPKKVAAVATTVIPAKPAATDEVLPAAPPATEAAPAEGEKVYTLSDSRDVLTAYLAKAGNGAETLIKELSVHGAKRINEVPQEHIHGFLKRMVEAS